jgi:electron transfer flavoprotein alpha subunit
MITIRNKAYEPLATQVPSLEVIRLNIKLDSSMIKVRKTGTFRKDGEQVRLEEAAIVVAGGRGLGGPAPFEDLKKLGRALGAAVGASRAATDAGWVDHSLQIGLTGKTIAPNLYITWGISGASQHMAGCSGAKCIVAINKDPDANIFKEASFGIIGNWDEVLPSFAEAVDKLAK